MQTGNILYTINREQGLHLAEESSKQPFAGLKNHSSLEGESARAEPAVEPVGGKGTSKIVRQVIQTSAEPTVELAEPSPPCALRGQFTWMNRIFRIVLGSPASFNPGHRSNG